MSMQLDIAVAPFYVRRMLRHSIRTAALSGTLLLAIGLAGGLALAGGRWQGALHGASVGFGLALVLGVHLVLRTLTGRTPESRTTELDPRSFERSTLERAAAWSFADMLSLSLLGVLVAFSVSDPTAVKVVLPVVVVISALDFVTRSLHGLRRGTSAA